MTQISSLEVIRQIDALFQQADKLWATLSPDERNRLNDVHNEDGSLGHCIRWGLQACAELGEKEASVNPVLQAQLKSYLERILATNPFFDVYQMYKANYPASCAQEPGESDLDFVRRCAEEDCEDGLDGTVCPPMFPEIAGDVVAGRPTPEPEIIKMTYLIVPAWSEQAGQCRIYSFTNHPTDPLAHYRAYPQAWKEVGIMNSRGQLVCLTAPSHVYQEFKDSEPLMAGTVFTFDEKPSPTNVAVYDQGTKSSDRYTVVYLDKMETANLHAARGLSAKPFDPQGFGMYTMATPGAHLGEMIRFEDLPQDCRQLVWNDLAADKAQTQEPLAAPAP